MRTSLPPDVVVLERGWLSSNNVLLLGDRGPATLVDSGYSSHSELTVALVTAALRGRGLERLINTHLHSDHCGGNAALQRVFPEMETAIPPGLVEAVKAWDPVALTYAPTGQVCERFTVHTVLQPGSVVEAGGRRWEVHAAPGHDPHSVILFAPDCGVLISADALWANGFGVVFQELEGESAFDEVAATLDLIERLAPRIVIPGHGPVFATVSDALSVARRRLDSFEQDPLRHATHAAKVLLKFKLLEAQTIHRSALRDWARTTQYFGLIRSRFWPEHESDQWIDSIIDTLCESGALHRKGEWIINR